MNLSPRTLAISAGVAALVTGLAYALGHRRGRRREQTINLARYRNRNRVLIIFAPSRGDARYQRQLREMSGHLEALADRDVTELHILSSGAGGTVTPSDASLLRAFFHVRRGSFRVVLLGKDGHAAINESSPITARELIEEIDAMPMRQQEMRRKATLQ